MLVIEGVELIALQHRAEIMVLDHQHRASVPSSADARENAPEIFDVGEDVGEGDEVGPTAACRYLLSHDGTK